MGKQLSSQVIIWLFVLKILLSSFCQDIWLLQCGGFQCTLTFILCYFSGSWMCEAIAFGFMVVVHHTLMGVHLEIRCFCALNLSYT